MISVINPLLYTAEVTSSVQAAEEAGESKFAEILERYRNQQALTASSASSEKSDDGEDPSVKKDNEEKINMLRARISRLKSELSMNGGNDPSIFAQISMLQTELFWLLFAMG